MSDEKPIDHKRKKRKKAKAKRAQMKKIASYKAHKDWLWNEDGTHKVKTGYGIR